jgi:hypothetical protein
MPELRMMLLKSLSQLELVFCIFYHFIEDTINTTGLVWFGEFLFCAVVPSR